MSRGRQTTVHQVPKPWLEKWLGTPAMRLLEAWWGFRSDRSGTTFAPLRTAALAAGITPAQAWRAAARLRDAGLVRSLGGEVKSDGHRLHHRLVLGSRSRISAHVPHVAVPDATIQWLRGASAPPGTWGGRRPGAGRKPRVTCEMKEAPNPRRLGARLPVSYEATDDGFALNYTRPLRPKMVRDKHFGIRAPSVPPDDTRDLERNVALEATRRCRLAETMLPCPSRTELGDPVYPWPPKIQADDTPVYRAKYLATCYRGAIETALSLKAMPFARGAITSSKHYATLVAAAKVLEEEKVPAASWATWSALVWKSYRWPQETGRGRRSSVPPVSWMYSVKRIRDHVGWFNEEAAWYYGGRQCAGPRWKSVVQRRALAVARIIRTENDPAEIIADLFPEGYTEAIRRSRVESEKTTKELKERALNGEWVWKWI